MLKNTLAIMVIGSLFSASNFASPFHLNKMLVKDHKQSVVSKNQTPNSESKFTGTWTGTCTHDGQTDAVNIRIVEDAFDLSIRDVMNECGNETVSFNVIETKSRVGDDFYESSTNRLTRINENTLKYEQTEVFARPSNTEKKLASGIIISTLTVNNNQLTIETRAKLFNENPYETVDQCILKRTG